MLTTRPTKVIKLEIMNRNKKDRYAMSTMNGIVWGKHITNKRKINIYNTVVKSITTYSSEVCQLRISNHIIIIRKIKGFLT